ncbi:MAG: hypothetical protein ABJ000_00520 [Saccharospirillum sp.]|uniref:hypothetical protein n=1 Tax=Saccharospirillum sp. TaxID=2033801 RepID=UPI003299AA52
MSTIVQPTEFASVFAALKALLAPYADSMTVSTDTQVEYYLNSRYIQKNKKPLFFAAVQIKKNYVSFHLMPVYVEPALLVTASDALKQRMQGKSCFNFTRTEPAMLHELALLTKTGYEHYQQAGLLADNGFLTQLSAPAQRALAQAGVQVPEDLEGFSEQDLLALHGVGPSAIPLLKSSLEARGLSFKPD